MSDNSPIAQPQQYDGSSIRKLTHIQAARVRPGMYIGSTDQRGLHQMLYDILDCSVDEVAYGAADHVKVVIRQDGVVVVSDNGQGIPIDLDPLTQKSLLELVMTQFHIGPRLGLGSDKTGLGGWGANIAVVNALSTWARAEVRRDSHVYAQEYREGVPTGFVTIVGADSEDRGTTIYFQADPTVFATIDYDGDVLAARCRELCYLIRGMKLTFLDERAGRERAQVFCFEDGIQSLVHELNRDCTVLHAPFYVGHLGETDIEVSLQYNTGNAETISTFVNTLPTVEGGTHLSGFRDALASTLNSYARTHAILSGNEANLTVDDVRPGLTAVVSVKLTNPQYVYATASKLGNPEIRGQVQSVVSVALRQFLAENPADARAIIEKCHMTAQRRAASQSRRRPDSENC